MLKILKAICAAAAVVSVLPVSTANARERTVIIKREGHHDRGVRHRHYGWERGHHYGWTRYHSRPSRVIIIRRDRHHHHRHY